MDNGTYRAPGLDAPHIIALPAVVETNAEGRNGVLVALSDLHIGGDLGQEDFFCHAELIALLDDLDRIAEPVTILINGDFFEFLQVTVPPGGNRARAVVEQAEHAVLFARLRQWNARPGHRTVYTVGNHDSETAWNAAIGAYLIAEGIVHDVALGYEHCFTSGGGELTVYAEHGNEEDSQNAIVDYGHPLIVPVGTHVVTQLVNRIEPLGRFAGPDDATTLSDIDNIYPLELVPWWLFSNYFYRQARRFVRYILVPAIVILLALRYLNNAIIRLSQGRLPEFSAGRLSQVFGFLILDVVVVLGLVLLMLRHDFMRWRRRSGLLEPLQIVAEGEEHYRASCRSFLAGERQPAHRQDRAAAVDVFVYGHNHIAELEEYVVGERRTAFINTGTWMRKIVRLPTRLKLPPVFIPVYQLTYAVLRMTPAGLSITLNERVKPLRYRLGWAERIATFRTRPPLPPAARAGQEITLARVTLPVPVPTPAEDAPIYARTR
ncbi:MAG: metallophosphoesterase [Thermomicrobiales bacterium]